MIKPLRSRHRVMILILAIVVPALFIAGLLLRPSTPSVNTTVPVPTQVSPN